MSPEQPKSLESRNPATGEVVGHVSITPVAAIPGLVARARAAQPDWAALGAAGRAELLRGAGAAMGERADELARLLTLEMGKPLAEAAAEVRSCAEDTADVLREVAEATAPEIIEDERVRSTIYRDPYGVCAAITPWNFPFSMPHWLIMPALATGNTVVFKPSEQTPLIGQAYADLVAAALPADVLQVVHGDETQGAALVAAEIDLIAFTGSRAAGKHILGAAAGRLKRVILELGGKDPLIVLDDADLDRAARFAARNSFRNAGQVCVATERIYVAEKIAEPFVTRLVAETSKFATGSGLDPATRVGPMISAEQRDHVLRLVDQAVSMGARVATGGAGHHGNFVTPTVLVDVRPDMAIATEETFGPVACVTVVKDDEEAVALANDTPFGLGAVVFGTDTGRTDRIARRLQAGMIGINQSVGGAKGSPWVGARESGYGYHSSRDGHRQFTQTRVVSQSR
ncbi:MAG TPA: aldehyde dehydrogenase family protein [Kofleriaceae bacterium]|nr:aldehyde dehydrogenase family protein [Kofleriaceae bacterium]